MHDSVLFGVSLVSSDRVIPNQVCQYLNPNYNRQDVEHKMLFRNMKNLWNLHHLLTWSFGSGLSGSVLVQKHTDYPVVSHYSVQLQCMTEKWINLFDLW